ncbi:MAG: helix-turn-helix domain-containing protein, partial [Blastocatellia bacterium]
MSKNESAIRALFTAVPAQRPRKTATKASTRTARAQEKPVQAPELDRLNQIYFAAARLFCENGFDATSMSDIADAVGITKAGIYHF